MSKRRLNQNQSENLANLEAVYRKLGDGHKRLQTRRDFIAHGLVAATSYAMVPSLLASFFMGQNANAWDAGQCPSAGPLSGLVPLITIDMAGGLSISGNIAAKKASGEYLTSYDTMGVPNELHPSRAAGNADTRFGAPLFSGTYNNGEISKFRQGFLAGLAKAADPARALANTRISTVCHTSQDDSGINPQLPGIMASRAGLVGSRLAQGLSAAATPTGGNSTSNILDLGYKPVAVSSSAALTNALGFGSRMSFLTPDQKSKLAAAISNMGSSQVTKFQSMNLGQQFKTLAGCGYIKNIDLAAGLSDLDASANAHVQAVYGAAGAGGQRATIAYNTLRQFTGSGTIVIGGCDYHATGQTNTDSKDLECGTELGNIIALASRLNIPVMVAGASDGSVSGTPGTRTFTSDSGTRGMSYMACFRPDRAPTQLRTQLGSFTDGQSADTTPFFGKGQGGTGFVDYVLFANYLAFCGRLDLIRDPNQKLIPRSAEIVTQQLDSILAWG